MTSKSSFTADQRELLKRRLWPAAVTMLAAFLFFVVGEAITFAGIEGEPGALYAEDTFRNFFGQTSAYSMITSALAVILAVQGFSWMDSRQTLDFYESQPVSRTYRFFMIHVSSLLIYTIGTVLFMIFGLLIAAGNGMTNAHPVQTALLFLLRQVLLFYASYMMSTLAVMLTGTVIAALLANAVFFGYEFLFRMSLSTLAVQFIPGWYAEGGTPNCITSPLWISYRDGGMAYIGNLILGTLFLVLAYCAYQKRRNESAGQAVLFGPVRTGAKAAIVFLGSGLVGIAFYSDNSIGTVGTVLLMVLAGVIISAVMEIIYHSDFKALFHGIPTMAVGIICAILLFFVFRFDVFGYGTALPTTDSVDYATVLVREYYTEHYLEDGSSVGQTQEFTDRYMRLTDIDSVNALLKAGIDTEISLNDGTAATDQYYFNVTISYHKKSGRVVRRTVNLPYADASLIALYDNVFGSEEYKEGTFQIYHDQFVRDHLNELSISYYNGVSTDSATKVSGEFYDAFNAAYLKDLTKFNYSLATDTRAVGDITMSLPGNPGQFFTYPVYAEYENTIAFLKDAGLYLEPVDTLNDIDINNIDAPFDEYFRNLYWEKQYN